MNETPKLWPLAWSLIRGQQRPALAGLALTILGIAASLLQPWPLKIIVDSILGAVPMPAWLGSFANDKAAALLVVCLALLAIHLVRGGLGAWGTTYLVRAGLRMTQELRYRVYEHLQKLSLVFHDSRAVGDSIYRVTWDTYSIQTIFNGGLIPLVSSAATLLGMVIIMLRFDVVLTLLALAVAPALALTIKHYNRLIADVSTQYHTRESKVSAMIQEALSSIRTIQAFARE
ncbi:MAG: ABC transporter transmembrane domain-containing protein, partial [Verrucomicrobiia bacterium]